MAFLGAVGHDCHQLAFVIIGNNTSDIVAGYMFWQKSSKPPQNDA
jgi:hypothetical protein